MRKRIENALFELGITPDLLGFDYIRKAVEIIQNSKDKIKIVDGLYADVAKEFNTSNQKVERAIRHAFTKVNKKREAFDKYLGVDNMTNSALLNALAYRLKWNESDEDSGESTYKVSNTHEISVDWNGYNFLIIYGKHINGWFIASPNWNICVEASDPTSVAYNSEKLCKAINLIDTDFTSASVEMASAIKEHWESLEK